MYTNGEESKGKLIGGNSLRQPVRGSKRFSSNDIVDKYSWKTNGGIH